MKVDISSTYYENCFDFPVDVGYDVSEEAKDLIRRLICSAEYRLGQNGLEDFKNHPWFVGINWENMQDTVAPYIPEVSSPTDTSNFDVDDTELRTSDAMPPAANPVFTGLHLPFVGFTFTQGSHVSDLGCLQPGKDGILNEQDQVDGITKNAYERRILKLERENKELSRKLTDACQTLQNFAHGPIGESGSQAQVTTGDSADVRRLQDEINALTKRNCELEAQMKNLVHEEAETMVMRKELDITENEKLVKMKELEKNMRLLKQEKDDVYKELVELQEKLKLQAKELKDALSQRKLAMTEYTEVSDKLSELRQHKQKLSRQVRDKEEELEVAMQKIDNLRQDVRKAEKLRREMETRIDEAQAEAGKERKLRERSEEYCKQMEEEMEKLKQRTIGESLSTSPLEASQEIARLKTELEKMDVQYKESVSQMQTRYSHEVAGLKEQIQETESARDMLEKEVCLLKEKLEQVRLENLTESEETIAEVKRMHEREKMLLIEDNKKLMMDLDSLSETINRLQTERRQLEDEYEELRNKKESIAHWEAQISEIIQWVSDEKDARGYLQALATKMTEELEYLKHSGVANTPASEKNWRNRRSQKLDKMELLNLQSSLQSEIQAKQAISEELTKTRSELISAQKDLRDFKQRLDNLSRDTMRKDTQIKELQQRLESGEGFLDRPPSQMSFFEQFLKESSSFRRGGSVESEEGDIEDNRALSLTSSKSNMSEISTEQLSPMGHEPRPLVGMLPSKPKPHQFLVRTFSSPLKCSHCTSLMVGLTRQGVVCEVCGFACHVGCHDKVPPVCPVPADQTKRPLGIDPTRGIGTAYEGYVKVPKPGGVKKGWMRQYVVVLDMRDEEFEVSSVRDSDVIHASKKDIPCIFRITTSLMDPPGLRNHTLMLAETEGEKTKWVVALNELHRILKRNNLPNKTVFRAKELLDNTITVIKNAMSGAIIDPDRLVIGTEEGLYCVDLDRGEIGKVGEGKKLYQIEYIPEEQLLIVLSGKQRYVRLIPVRALDGTEVEWIKVSETKGCITFTTGIMKSGPQAVYCLCVAVKRQNASQVIIYEITRTKTRHKRVREVLLPAQAQTLDIFSDCRLCIGYQSGFTIYSLSGEQHPQSLVHPDNQMLGFLAYNPVDALCAIELPRGEFLLVFNTLAVYVDIQGRKSRDKEIMYPAIPTAVSFCDGHFLVYGDTHIDVFNCASGEWMQTINLRKAKPLCRSGAVTVMCVSELPHVVYLSNIHKPDYINVPHPEISGRSAPRTRRRFSIRENRAARTNTDRRSKMISAPSNFNHITHMGPGDGIKIQQLMDLPTTLETADSHPHPIGPHQSMQRVRSMLQHSAVKLVTPRPPPNAEPPRRSISHQPGLPPQHQSYNVHNGAPPPGHPPPPRRPMVPPPAVMPRPPSHPRSPEGPGVVGGGEPQHFQATSATAPNLGSVGSVHEEPSMDGSPRHSIASNNSSNLSTPPSPGRDQGSSSYES